MAGHLILKTIQEIVNNKRKALLVMMNQVLRPAK